MLSQYSELFFLRFLFKVYVLHGQKSGSRESTCTTDTSNMRTKIGIIHMVQNGTHPPFVESTCRPTKSSSCRSQIA